jgi:hypothetical protein
VFEAYGFVSEESPVRQLTLWSGEGPTAAPDAAAP